MDSPVDIERRRCGKEGFSLRPILIGIDPGKNDGGPLSPSFPSGARLAELAGMPANEFLEKFDRINMHPTSVGSDSSNDYKASRNLFPILRGRRVVYLGQRVSAAMDLDIHRGVKLEWSLSYENSHIGVAFPHPSGLSRWWNDPKNVEASRRFMRDLTLPCVHVEGPDGSGKSTLVTALAPLLRCMTAPTQDPPKSWSECLRRIHLRIIPGTVCDRSSGLISELVYGPVLRGGTSAPEADVWWVVGALVHAVMFVYCRPPVEKLYPTFRFEEDRTHVEGINQHLGLLVERYDAVMSRLSGMGARVIRYDWTQQTPKELAQCVA